MCESVNLHILSKWISSTLKRGRIAPQSHHFLLTPHILNMVWITNVIKSQMHKFQRYKNVSIDVIMWCNIDVNVIKIRMNWSSTGSNLWTASRWMKGYSKLIMLRRHKVQMYRCIKWFNQQADQILFTLTNYTESIESPEMIQFLTNKYTVFHT